MAHDASNNNPVKEIVHSLLGILLLLTIIAGIAVSAWLRPAGNHEPATEPATPAGKALAEKLQSIEKPAEAPADKPAEPAPEAQPADTAKSEEAKGEEAKSNEATATAEAGK